MARAAFVMERVMRWVAYSKIVCANDYRIWVQCTGVMARTLENYRERFNDFNESFCSRGRGLLFMCF